MSKPVGGKFIKYHSKFSPERGRDAQPPMLKMKELRNAKPAAKAIERDLSRKIAELWKLEPADVKEKYRRMNDARREVYQKRCPGYRYKSVKRDKKHILHGLEKATRKVTIDRQRQQIFIDSDSSATGVPDWKHTSNTLPRPSPPPTHVATYPHLATNVYPSVTPGMHSFYLSPAQPALYQRNVTTNNARPRTSYAAYPPPSSAMYRPASAQRSLATRAQPSLPSNRLQLTQPSHQMQFSIEAIPECHPQETHFVAHCGVPRAPSFPDPRASRFRH